MLNKNSIISDINNNGVAVINSYINKHSLDLLNKEYKKIIHNTLATKGIEYTPYSSGVCARITSSDFSFEDFPAMKKIFFNDHFLELSEIYLGTKDIKFNGEIFVVKDIIGTRHIANDLHYDVAKTFKFFIYLTDTTAENGAFTCVPGSHKKTAEYRADTNKVISYENRDITRQLDTHLFDDPIPIEGKAGTLIIFDTDTWHKAGVVTKGERNVMRGHTRTFQPKNMNQSLFKKIIKKFKS